MDGPTTQLLTITVLVVDDDDDVRQVMARDLEGAGYTVLTAADGIEALTVLKSGTQINLVICDSIMPRLDGYELAARLAASLNAPKTMLISNYGRNSELDRAIVTKPFRTADLTAAVQRMFET